MTLNREKAVRLACNPEIAGIVPALAIMFEMCESKKRAAKKKSPGCGGCTQTSASFQEVGDQTLAFLLSADQSVVDIVKRHLSAQKLIIQINGVKIVR
jgi:hypothetical protein